MYILYTYIIYIYYIHIYIYNIHIYIYMYIIYVNNTLALAVHKISRHFWAAYGRGCSACSNDCMQNTSVVLVMYVICPSKYRSDFCMINA